MKMVSKNINGVITVKELLFAANAGLKVWMQLSHYNLQDRHKNFNGKTSLEKANEGWYIGNIDIELNENEGNEYVAWDLGDSRLVIYRLKNIDYE
jgi:hypothetical protein